MTEQATTTTECLDRDGPSGLYYSERELWQTHPAARPALERLARYRADLRDLRNAQQGAVDPDDEATVERVAKALMDTPPDMLTAEPYTVARALLAAAYGGQ